MTHAEPRALDAAKKVKMNIKRDTTLVPVVSPRVQDFHEDVRRGTAAVMVDAKDGIKRANEGEGGAEMKRAAVDVEQEGHGVA